MKRRKYEASEHYLQRPPRTALLGHVRSTTEAWPRMDVHRASQPWCYWHFGQIIILARDRPGHRRMFNRIAGLYLLDVKSTPKSWQPKITSDIAKYSLGWRVKKGRWRENAQVENQDGKREREREITQISLSNEKLYVLYIANFKNTKITPQKIIYTLPTQK